MPIVGCVVTIKPHKAEAVESEIRNMKGVDVYGGEVKDNLYLSVVVLEAERYHQLEKIEDNIKAIDGVLDLSVAEAYFLDEFEKIENGEIIPENPFHGLKREEKKAERLFFGEEQEE